MKKALIPILLALTILLNACAQPSSATPTPPTATAARTMPPFTQPAPTAIQTLEKGAINLTGTPQQFWWNDTVFYEIFVRSFYDSDGDGIGDFNGLTQKLDYLNDGDPNTTTDLGITGIWLMPINPSPSYHGYDVTDYQNVNPQYGSLDDFRRFLMEAHRRGIRVIMDLILNHTSSQHPWFLEGQNPASPYHDYYIWSETDPGYKGPDGQTVWHQARNGSYYYGFFWSEMPDLNYRNPAVVKTMQEVARYWLKDIGVDGFRLDAAHHLVENGKDQINTPETHAFWKDFRTFYKQVEPEAMTVGEIWDKSANVAPYAQGDELDLAFEFDLASAWVIAASSKDARPARTVLKRDMPQFKPGQFAVFLTNHDQNRLMTQVGGDAQKARAAAALLLTSPGVPFIYYGEEIGMTGQKPDEDIRRPMQWNAQANGGFSTGTPWEPLHADTAQVNAAEQDKRPDSLLNLYRGLIQVRNSSEALRRGVTYPVESSQKTVYALLKVTGDQGILVLVNMGAEEITDYTINLPKGPLSGNFSLKPLFGEGKFNPIRANAGGGFDAYRPLDTLPGGAIFILELVP